MIRIRHAIAPGTRQVSKRARLVLPFLALGLAIGLGACATRPNPADTEAVAEFRANNDPLEPLNRGAYFVNDGIDTLVLRPAAEIYRIFLPPEVRTAIRNVLANLRTPVILANDLLQGETQRAATTTGRFLVNTTVGLGGIFDRATDFGLIGHTEDFGQTLAVWGAPAGPYLFIPVLGPSSPRDVVGFAGDVALNPLTYTTGTTMETINVTRTATTALGARERLIEPLDQVRATSLDPYATIRSAYRQRRVVEIRNEATGAAATSDSGLGSGIQGLRR